MDNRRKEKNEPEVVEPPKQDVQKATRQEEIEKRLEAARRSLFGMDEM